MELVRVGRERAVREKGEVGDVFTPEQHGNFLEGLFVRCSRMAEVLRSRHRHYGQRFLGGLFRKCSERSVGQKKKDASGLISPCIPWSYVVGATGLEPATS